MEEIDPDKRYELYCQLVSQLAVSKDVNKIIDLIIKLGWRPKE